MLIYIYICIYTGEHNSFHAGFLHPAWAGVGDGKDGSAAYDAKRSEGWRTVLGFLPFALRGRRVFLLFFLWIFVDTCGYLWLVSAYNAMYEWSIS